MKRSTIYRLILLCLCCVIFSVSYTQKIFTGSTPGNEQVMTFLNIPADSKIDFIRWELDLTNPDKFIFKANYGEGQPNTLGFKKGGKFIESEGTYTVTKNNHHEIFQLKYKNATISLLKLTDNLLHFLTDENNLMRGNGGWSYTLNKKDPVKENNNNLVFLQQPGTKVQETIYEGRTPCKELAEDYKISSERECIKLKWLLTLKRDPRTLKPTTYTLNRTLERSRLIEGKWDIVTDDQGMQIIHLLSEKDEISVKFLPAGENVLFFLNMEGFPFTGNENFSYTLNRRIK